MLLNQMGVLGDSFWQQDMEGWESGNSLSCGLLREEEVGNQGSS